MNVKIYILFILYFQVFSLFIYLYRKKYNNLTSVKKKYILVFFFLLGTERKNGHIGLTQLIKKVRIRLPLVKNSLIPSHFNPGRRHVANEKSNGEKQSNLE